MTAHSSDIHACLSLRPAALPSISVSQSSPRSPGRTRSPRPPSDRQIILFLAANPRDTSRLALDEECAGIERELRMSLGRDDFDLRSKWAVSVDEMMRHLNEWRPAVIHFSGHGSGAAAGRPRDGQHRLRPPRRDIEAARAGGIYLQEARGSRYVSGDSLARMIASGAPSARVVVLNACFSDAVAESLRSVVDCVVGMNGAIGDDVARSFAVSFYRALGSRRSVGNAVAQAVATLAAKELPGESLPVCRTRDGVNADQVFLPSRDIHWP